MKECSHLSKVIQLKKQWAWDPNAGTSGATAHTHSRRSCLPEGGELLLFFTFNFQDSEKRTFLLHDLPKMVARHGDFILPSLETPSHPHLAA